MKKRLFGACFAAAVLASLSVGALAWDADFEPSTYNPAVGESVALAVCEPCLGEGSYQYRWDFEGDGTQDLETDDPIVNHVFDTAGFYSVEVTLVDETGRRKSKRKGILVGDEPAHAVREMVEQADGTIFVLLSLHLEATVSVPAVEESMPRGWQFELLDDGGAITRTNAVDRIYEIVWMSEADEETELKFSYRLHPTSSTGTVTPLGGTFSGYVDGIRFVGEICGELEIEF